MIAPDVVLTAAHCLLDNSASAIIKEGQVFIGILNIDKPSGPAYKIKDIRIHSEFSTDPTYKNDVGLIFLDSPAKAQPAALSACSPTPGKALEMAGWGLTASTQKLSVKLLKTKVRILQDKICKRALGPLFDVEQSICADGMWHKGVTSSPCHGDSGGPLYSSKDIIAGVVSYTIHEGNNFKCGTALTSIFMDVSTFIPWIRTYTDDIMVSRVGCVGVPLPRSLPPPPPPPRKLKTPPPKVY